MISNRIFENSSDKNHFNKAAPDYKIALKNSVFDENLAYINSRQIIWLNQYYSANVKTTVCKTFMRLVNKRFSGCY